MQPSSGQDVSPGVHGETLDGRDSLRLVRIRLALTLIAVAILPFAAVAPIARAVLDDTRTGLEQRLAADAEHAAAIARRELNGVRETLEGLAASGAVAAALTVPAGDTATAPAVVELREVLERPSGVVAGVAVADPGGIHARAGSESTTFAGIPPRGTLSEFNLAPSGGAEPALEIVAPIPAAAEGPPLGWVVASVNVPTLIRWASPGAASSGRSVRIVDARGETLAGVGPENGINLPATVIDMAANGSETSAGTAPLGIPQLEGWQIVASAPLPVSAIPFPEVASLIGLLVVLVWFILWMARQILRPAAELDARRARLHELYEVAREASLRDSLTGLGNHRAFQEAVARMVEQTRRYGSPFSLILLDIDDFKRINDARGHATGDELLREVGDLIRSTVRNADAGYRIGGDEFAILLPSTDTVGAATTARRMLTHGLDDRPAGRYRGPISFSAGVTACPGLGATRMELTAQADAALYRGKRGGRTIVTVYDPALDRGHVDEGMRAELSAAVAVVIETGVLSPVYQPIVELATGRILGYEGLVRAGAEGGFPNIDALFDAAEVAGRVLDLDRAALDVVLRGARRLPASTLLSLNVSPRSLEAPEFNASIFLAILRHHDVAPERVILELTEREAIRNLERLQAAIVLLRTAGVRIAADDVGAGNAGLRLLSQFRFDVVKIDLSLVQGGATQDQTLSVLTSIVDLARQWGALTIAEGVETAAQLQMIRDLGIDAGQGYILGRPGTVMDAGHVDLDSLTGGLPSLRPRAAAGTDGADGPAVGPRATPAGAVPISVGAVVGAATVVAWPQSSSGAVAGSAVPTAASIIAGGAPNPFARG